MLNLIEQKKCGHVDTFSVGEFYINEKGEMGISFPRFFYIEVLNMILPVHVSTNGINAGNKKGKSVDRFQNEGVHKVSTCPHFIKCKNS